jgi:hypothetical protein
MKLNELKSFIKKTISESQTAPEGFVTEVKMENIFLYYEKFYDKFNQFEDRLLPDEDLGDLINKAPATVYWSMEFDFKDWGIKSVDVFLKKVVINFEISSRESNLYEEITFDSEVEGFELKNEMVFDINSVFLPFELEIDFKDKTVSVGS